MASMSGWDEPEPQRSGLKNLVRLALWAAGSLGAFVAVLLWSFDLGLRSPEDVPALKVALEGEWRTAPEDPGGRQIPDQQRGVYDRFDGGVKDDGVVLAAPSAERPTEADREAARVAGAGSGQGAGAGSDAFLALVAQAVDNPDAATRQRVIDLDLQSPRAGAPANNGLGKPSAPPNVGLGAEPAPKQTEEVEKPAENLVDDRDAGRNQIVQESVGRSVTAPGESVNAPKVAEVEVAPDTVIETAEAMKLEQTGQVPDDETAERAASAEGGAEVASLAPDERLVDSVLITPQTKSGSQRPAGPEIYQVQLAALDSVAMVEKRWAELQQLEPALLGKLDLDLQPANVRGTRLYRLRVGSFSNREQAADLCRTLRDKGIECFPATRAAQ